jgi:hypothetical protein
VRNASGGGALAAIGVVLVAGTVPAWADLPPPTPHVGFYTVHPRVGLSTHFSLSASWPHTQEHTVGRIHFLIPNYGALGASGEAAPEAGLAPLPA